MTTVTILSSGVVVFEDGTNVPVVAWIDNNGDECTVEDAVCVVYGTDATGYSYSKFSADDRIKWQ